MSTPKPPDKRQALELEVLLAARRSSTAAVLLHTALAELFGLTATDMKTIELLDRHGPLSAGDLASYTGLAATSVTSLIDRLERRNLVRRTADPSDRRRVLVELVPERPPEMSAPYAAIARATMEHIKGYTDAQLRAIHQFLTAGSEQVEKVVAEFASRSGQPSTKPAEKKPEKKTKQPKR